MAKVEIIEDLKKQVFKKFKQDSRKVFAYMKTLEDNPHKGKPVGNVGGLVIKELKYGSFRFYFYADGNKLRFFSKERLEDLLIRFVRMSDKKSQQKTINEIKSILRRFGEEEF